MTTAVTSALAGTAASEDSPSPGRAPSGRRRRSTLTRGAGLGLGVAMLWFSLLVLIPLAAVVASSAAGGRSFDLVAEVGGRSRVGSVGALP